MTRIVKAPDIRRAEIVNAAAVLFHAHGYRNTSVDVIIRQAGIAKGTFYYYFQSKEEVLAAIVHELVVRLVADARSVADDPSLGAIEKTRALLRSQDRAVQGIEQGLLQDLHLPENRELHERTNVETILAFAPILAGVVEQGNREGLFHVKQPLETVQFLLAGSQFLTDNDLFSWTPDEQAAHARALQAIIERALGAPNGSFGFLAQPDPSA